MNSVAALATLMAQPAFVAFLLVVILGALVLIFFVAPKHGRSNIFVYLAVCSLVGSLNVMAAKGLAKAIVATVNGVNNEFANGITYLLIANMLVCMAIQVIYVNKALEVFGAALVSRVYYVLFTVCVLVGAGILYDEFTFMLWYNILGLAVGFFVIVLSLLLLHMLKVYTVGRTRYQLFLFIITSLVFTRPIIRFIATMAFDSG